MRGQVVLPAALLLTAVAKVSSITYEVASYYNGVDCSGDPSSVYVYEPSDGNCTTNSCYANDLTGVVSTECTTDYVGYIQNALSGSEYIIQTLSKSQSCGSLFYALGFRADQVCNAGYYTAIGANSSGDTVYAKIYYQAALDDSGGASINYFTTSDCSSGGYDIASVSAAESMINSDTCSAADYNSFVYATGLYWQWFSSSSGDDSGSGSGGGGLSSGAIIGIAAGGVVALLMIVGVILLCRRRKAKQNKTLTTTTNQTATLEAALSGKQACCHQDAAAIHAW
ncbi:hypothetical protein PHYBOEH_002679 [Phytophthora boehmeriae]|uniref:TKL protein kinase n=1 Tax=Phytophthora boehmeriae TaxID=109152 RepID=A0A8T1V4T9_9STRA|nr:hypothetical protein PHYBOEH_002679 [Phytophthora boehmeriae]